MSGWKDQFRETTYISNSYSGTYYYVRNTYKGVCCVWEGDYDPPTGIVPGVPTTIVPAIFSDVLRASTTYNTGLWWVQNEHNLWGLFSEKVGGLIIPIKFSVHIFSDYYIDEYIYKKDVLLLFYIPDYRFIMPDSSAD